LPHLYLEASPDRKTWATIIDFGEVGADPVYAEQVWDGVSELRVRWTFKPHTTWYWRPKIVLD
jgi:hypothetical protein